MDRVPEEHTILTLQEEDMKYDVIIVGADLPVVCSQRGSLRIPDERCCCWRPAPIIPTCRCSLTA